MYRGPSVWNMLHGTYNFQAPSKFLKHCAPYKSKGVSINIISFFIVARNCIWKPPSCELEYNILKSTNVQRLGVSPGLGKPQTDNITNFWIVVWYKQTFLSDVEVSVEFDAPADCFISDSPKCEIL
jgi:hypothetical protein